MVPLGPPIHDVSDRVRQRRPDRALRKDAQRLLGVMRELFATPPGVVDAAGIGDDGRSTSAMSSSSGASVPNSSSMRRRPAADTRGKRRDQRQRHLVLAQVETARLSGHRLVLGVVENVVGDLERHAQAGRRTAPAGREIPPRRTARRSRTRRRSATPSSRE